MQFITPSDRVLLRNLAWIIGVASNELVIFTHIGEELAFHTKDRDIDYRGFENNPDRVLARYYVTPAAKAAAS